MAIIYSYPPNSNILPTDILICTSTVLVGGKPKNQTKSISIQNLTSYVNTSSTNNLDQVLSNGNYSLLFANVGQLGLFDTSENDYALLKISDSEFIFEDVNGIATSQSRRGITLLGDGVHYGSIYLPPYTTSHQYDLPDNTGTIALTSDIPVVTGFVPYTGATQAVDLGAFNLTVNGISVGKGAGSGTANVAIGVNALGNNTTGSANTANGDAALYSNTTGIQNVAIGRAALFSSTTVNNNIAVGYYALSLNTATLAPNSAVGTEALKNNTTGYVNTAIGYQAMFSNTTGGINTAMGHQALYTNTTGSYNVALGSTSLLGNTTGYQNTAVGTASLRGNSTGYFNVGIGFQTMYQTNTGNSNVAVGHTALTNNNSGSQNVALGTSALLFNTTGGTNTAVGYRALWSNTTSSYNTSVGSFSMNDNTTGTFNSAVGVESLANNTTGNYNCAFGNNALLNTTTGSDNTAVGGNAISNNTTGIQNVGLGKFSSLLNATDSNCVVIGFNAIGAGSNTVTLGNVSTTTTRLRGAVRGGSFVKDGGTSAQYLMADGSVTTAPYKYNFGGSLVLTGTLTTTNLLTITIPANSLTDYLDIRSIMIQQSGPILGGMTVRVWHNSVNNFNTAIRIANYAFGVGGADLFTQITRRFSLQSGLLFGFPALGSNIAGEGSTSNAALSIPFDPAAINYLFVSIQLNNATDTATLRNVNITT